MDFLFYQNSIYFLIFLLVSGALLAFPLLRKQGKGNTGLSVKDAVNLVNRENAVFVDVRSADSYRSGSIPSARNLPAADFEQKAGTLPRNKPLILVCDNGRESAKMADALRSKNTENVYTLAGGMGAWKADGMPVKQHS